MGMLTNPGKVLIGSVRLLLSRHTGLNLLGERLENTFNFLQLSDRIATAGQPTENQLLLVKQAGYQVVINLAPTTALNLSLTDERATVESLSMKYFHIPVIATNPTVADFDRFVEIMQTYADQPVFVHCAGNYRVSAFMYLYRRLYEQINEAQARVDLNKLWNPPEEWSVFIQTVMDRENRSASNLEE